MSRCTYHLLVDLLSSAVSTKQTDRQDQLANNRLCLTVFLDDIVSAIAAAASRIAHNDPAKSAITNQQ
ncbi:TPA: hypothetical protein ACIEZ2_000906 [Streptococcus pyogenes]